MPADSDARADTLPVTFRPLGVRIAVVVFGLGLVAVTVAIWFAFPQHTRDAFTVLQRLTVLGFGLAYAMMGHALGRCRIDAREDGLLLVNGYRSHLHPWDQVSRITLRDGAPWGLVDLADGTTVPAMGIQGSDGARAVRQVKQLRAIQRSRQG